MRTQAAYDLWASQYDADPNPQIQLEFDDVLSLIDPQPNQSILDAACGTGRYARILLQRGANVIGVDFSDQMLAIAREKNPSIRFINADLQKPLDFESGVFDKILCAQALKHLPDLEPVFKEFARVLKTGGHFVFSVTHPDMDWDGYELADQDPNRFKLTQHADIHHHKFSHYFQAIELAGFTVDRIVQIPVSEKIRPLLTPQSYLKVKGRFQILAMRLAKSK